MLHEAVCQGQWSFSILFTFVSPGPRTMYIFIVQKKEAGKDHMFYQKGQTLY